MTVLYNNINGYQSKAESLQEVVANIKPEIIALCETRLSNQNTLKRDLKDYELITKHVKKGKGGILCGIKQNIGVTSILEVTTTTNSNILTVKISFSNLISES